MSAMTTWQQPENSAVQQMAAGAHNLVQWAQEADAAYSLAQKLTSTSFCPEQFRGKPQEAAAAMLAGTELGLSPMTALGAFDVIQGRAAARAITLRALVQSKGHEMVLAESTSTRCVMKGKRAGSSEWQQVAWTIDRAKDLRLTGKQNWQQQPQAMLIARATSELARLIASDALLGIGGGYSAEEVEDGAAPQQGAPAPTAPTPPSAGKRTLGRKKQEPPAEPEPTPEPTEPEPDADNITSAQTKKLGALMREVGLTDRAAALAWVAAEIGREISSRNELTKAEASAVIHALERQTQTGDDEWPPPAEPGGEA